jgi:hypothetical protein
MARAFELWVGGVIGTIIFAALSFVVVRYLFSASYDAAITTAAVVGFIKLEGVGLMK